MENIAFIFLALEKKKIFHTAKVGIKYQSINQSEDISRLSNFPILGAPRPSDTSSWMTNFICTRINLHVPMTIPVKFGSV